MEKPIRAIIKGLGKELAMDLAEKTFSTGSTGYHSSCKLVVSEAEKYQVNILVVRIGSKPVKTA